jgi:hypothetical protein
MPCQLENNCYFLILSLSLSLFTKKQENQSFFTKRIAFIFFSHLAINANVLASVSGTDRSSHLPVTLS